MSSYCIPVSFDLFLIWSSYIGDLECKEWKKSNLFFACIESPFFWVCISRQIDLTLWFVIWTEINFKYKDLIVPRAWFWIDLILMRETIRYSYVSCCTLKHWPLTYRVQRIIFNIESLIWVESSKNWFVVHFVGIFISKLLCSENYSRKVSLNLMKLSGRHYFSNISENTIMGKNLYHCFKALFRLKFWIML